MPRKGRRTLAGRWTQIEQEWREKALVALEIELRRTFRRARGSDAADPAWPPTDTRTTSLRRPMN
jgi:hypothetical protein